MADPKGFLNTGRELPNRRPIDVRIQDWIVLSSQKRKLIEVLVSQRSDFRVEERTSRLNVTVTAVTVT